VRSFINCKLTKYYSGDQIAEDEIGWACSMHERDEQAHNILIGKKKKLRDHLEHLGIDGSII